MSTSQVWWPRRRVEPGDDVTEAEDIAATNKDAQAMNAYNARVTDAVDSFLAHAARGAVVLVGGCVLFVHAINVIAEALQ